VPGAAWFCESGKNLRLNAGGTRFQAKKSPLECEIDRLEIHLPANAAQEMGDAIAAAV
jgi:hypothetical protein